MMVCNCNSTPIKTRTLKPGREHKIPGARRSNEWPPLTKCCNSEIHYITYNGCDSKKIVFETHYYCKKCGEFLGHRRNETFYKQKEPVTE